MRKHDTLIAILLVFSLTTLAEAAKTICPKDGKIRYVQGQKQRVVPTKYCYDTGSDYFLAARCRKGKKCEATRKRQLMLLSIPTISAQGNPSHHRCMLDGGRPQIAEYWTGKDWKDVDLCHYKDKSFAGISYLEVNLW